MRRLGLALLATLTTAGCIAGGSEQQSAGMVEGDAGPSIAAGTVRRHVSPASLSAWSLETLVEVANYPQATIEAVPQGSDFPATPTLVTTPAHPGVYVVDASTRRHMVSPASFAAWRFNASAVQTISAGEFALLPVGGEWPETPFLLEGSGHEIDVLDSAPPAPER
jgi:hypothetical protein